MEKTKLRRSLYIGLGGTGMSAILHTKKLYTETYGEVPPMIGFLVIDTDGKAYNETLNSKVKVIKIDNNEQKSVSVSNPGAFYKNPNNRDTLSWFPSDFTYNVLALEGFSCYGAGQVRSNGKMAVTMNYPSILSSIQAAIDKVRNHITIVSEKYESDDDRQVDVHLVFSLCGGTGCGTFLDIAFITRECREDINLTGYAVLPDVFTTMVRNGTAMSKVKPNAYGAIQDLDYLMHLHPNSEPVKLIYGGETIETTNTPFDTVMLIDNKNESNITYENIDQLTEMIALTLFISSGKIGDTGSSINDNTKKTRLEGTLNVGNKAAWVSSIGACEIVFKGDELAYIYACKAAIRIIQRIAINACEDANSIANNWIDNPEINIRENNGNDNLINQIWEEKPFRLSDVGVEQPEIEVQEYYADATPTEKELNMKLETLLKRVSEGLHKLVIEHINKGECCVTTTLGVLEDILRQVDIFSSEMTDEIEESRKKLPVLENAVKKSIEDLQQWEKKSFFVPGKKRRIEEAKKEITEAAWRVAMEKTEIKRRDYANKLYTALRTTISDEYDKVNVIKNTFLKVNNDLSAKILAIQNDVDKRTAVFEIDLSKGTEVIVDDETILLSEFIDSLPAKSLYELGDSQAIHNALLNYTEQLSEAKKWKNKDIDSILDTLDEKEFKELIRIASEKAKPLLKFDGGGESVSTGKILEQAIDKFYFVGVADVGSSRLKKYDWEEAGKDVKFMPIGSHNKIIFYRQEGVVPAFAINPLKSFHSEYEKCTTFSHYDVNLKARMEEEEYSLYPKAKADDDIEYWIKGLIFKFIKFEEKKYWYKDWKNGKALKDYWVPTNETTRDKAYEKFKRHISGLRKSYTEKIEEIIATEGKNAVKKLTDDVRTNYFTKYAQCEASKETLSKKGYEKVAGLIEEELQYIETKLSI